MGERHQMRVKIFRHLGKGAKVDSLCGIQGVVSSLDGVSGLKIEARDMIDTVEQRQE